MANELIQQLQAAVDGLLYPSESDEPFTVSVGAGEAAADVVAGQPGVEGRKIRTVPLQAFFNELLDAPDAERFQTLHAKLRDHLTDVNVYRVGEGERKVDVLIVGKANSGSWVILRTRSVET